MKFKQGYFELLNKITFHQVFFTIQGCLKTSSISIRFSGFAQRRPLIKFFASELIVLSKLIPPFKELRNKRRTNAEYVIEGFALTFCFERWFPCYKFVAENPEAPYIDALIITITFYHLWGDIIWGSTECLSE